VKTILFQGDSITDSGRSRECDDSRGYGYATIASGRVGLTYPNEYNCINRAVSGDRIVDIYARIKMDIINLKPDYMSILIGVNDTWHEISRKNGVLTEKFEKIYTMLLQEIFEVLPNIRIFLMLPYITHGTSINEQYDEFYNETKKRAAAAKRVAEKFSLPYINLQEKFNEAVKNAPDNFWTLDGVHPTVNGHALIAEEWFKMFEKIK